MKWHWCFFFQWKIDRSSFTIPITGGRLVHDTSFFFVYYFFIFNVLLRVRELHTGVSHRTIVSVRRGDASVLTVCRRIFSHLRGVPFTSETFGTRTLGHCRQSEQNRQTIFELINVDGRPRRLMSRARVFSLFPTAPLPPTPPRAIRQRLSLFQPLLPSHFPRTNDASCTQTDNNRYTASYGNYCYGQNRATRH